MTDGTTDYRSEGGIAIITLNRPHKRNAMTAAMCEQLREALMRLRDCDDRVGILCAEGATFSAGADLTAPPAQFWRAVPDIGVDVGKPIIAAIQGPVIGMAIAILAYCDLCVAAEDTRLIYPEAKVGISKGLISGITARVPHKIAMELMLTGGPISAARAYDVGFVNRVVPPGQQLAAALEMARGLAESAPLVLAQLKEFARQTIPMSPAETMYRSMAMVDKVGNSEDAAEGLRAFQEKRAPRFQGR
ncbi:MAG TPA: enoyl-CoA hydratase-related protein [Ramlibacter sp.]|nr:enoyl-CoA hydratase-related protein [Ramlibacter sp.]